MAIKEQERIMGYNGTNLIAFMKESSSSHDFDRRCDIVKRHHDGDYPPNWYAEIISSGLRARITGTSSDITFRSYGN